jgi:hypothetical protein
MDRRKGGEQERRRRAGRRTGKGEEARPTRPQSKLSVRSTNPSFVITIATSLLALATRAAEMPGRPIDQGRAFHRPGPSALCHQRYALRVRFTHQQPSERDPAPAPPDTHKATHTHTHTYTHTHIHTYTHTHTHTHIHTHTHTHTHTLTHTHTHTHVQCAGPKLPKLRTLYGESKGLKAPPLAICLA